MRASTISWVSLDSTDAQVHDSHRGIPGLHAKVIKVLGWMRDDFLRGHRTGGIMCAIARHNESEVASLIGLAERCGVYIAAQPYNTNKTGDGWFTAATDAMRFDRFRSGAFLNSQQYLPRMESYRPGGGASARNGTLRRTAQNDSPR